MLLTSDLQSFKFELLDPETRHLRVESQIRVGIPLQIRAMREMRGWTQGELAEKVGTTQNTISRLENPASNTPNVSTLERLAEAFDVGLIVRFAPFSDFFDFSRRMSKNSVAVPGFEDELIELEKAAERARSFAFGPTLHSTSPDWLRKIWKRWHVANEIVSTETPDSARTLSTLVDQSNMNPALTPLPESCHLGRGDGFTLIPGGKAPPKKRRPGRGDRPRQVA